MQIKILPIPPPPPPIPTLQHKVQDGLLYYSKNGSECKQVPRSDKDKKRILESCHGSVEGLFLSKLNYCSFMQLFVITIMWHILSHASNMSDCDQSMIVCRVKVIKNKYYTVHLS